jgi:catalase
LIAYIEPSADPVLQSRLFSYPDAHRHRLGVNYQQLPVNAPVNPVANFQRDGAATFISQGNRPNYQSTIQPLTYAGRKGTAEGSARDHEREAKHESFIGGAFRDLSEITERKQNLVGFWRFDLINSISVDFEQPRALWQKVWDDRAREVYVQNAAAHFGGVKSSVIKARQRE